MELLEDTGIGFYMDKSGCLIHTLVLGLQMGSVMSGFCVGVEDLNSGPHVCGV